MNEPLRISEIIKELNTIKDAHGDIKIGTFNDGIIKFIRSVDFIEATDENDNVVDSCAVLQWWRGGNNE